MTMKKNQKDQLRAMSFGDLCKEIASIGKMLTDLTTKKKDSSSRNVRAAKALRIRRAVSLTILREKELKI